MMLSKVLRSSRAATAVSSRVQGLSSRLMNRTRVYPQCHSNFERKRCSDLKWFSAAAAAGDSSLQVTGLYDFHEREDAKFTEFAGYMMPVFYKNMGVKQEHLHTREKASLFDVSHMGQVRFRGQDAAKFMEFVTTGDFQNCPEGEGRYTLITNDKGGIVDDGIITNVGDYFNFVINAGRKDADLLHLGQKLNEFKLKGGDVSMEHLEKQQLIALQGPEAMNILQSFLPADDLSQMPFMTGKEMAVRKLECRLAIRMCGYTGEDGFEISVPPDQIETVVARLATDERLKPAGLGARDSLRLEAGLCLYGNDITEETTPVEAGLIFAIAKGRRDTGGFPGFDVINDQRQNKSWQRKRVGLTVKGAPAREGTKVFDPESGEEIGEVTSGSFGPTVNKPIAMAYLSKGFTKADTEVEVEVRGKRNKAVVTKMPFVPHKYYKP